MQREVLERKIREGGSYFAAPKRRLHFIPSGCKTLDLALGGGWARDRICNIVGDKSTGKTLLAIEAGANFGLRYPKGVIRYREVERSFDEHYAAALGMPMDRVDFGKWPLDTVEDLFEDLSYYANRIIKRGLTAPELYICDSLDALTDRSEQTRDIDEGTFGAEKAKRMSQLFRRMVRRLSEARITLMIISQVRSRIGIRFGRPTTRTGGRALDFYASQVLYLSQLKPIVRNISGIKRPTGINIRAKVDKNKIAIPYRETEFRIMFGYGVDDVAACLEFLNQAGGLREVGVKAEKIDSFARHLMDGGDRHQVHKIHDMVEKYWYDIEGRLLPKRPKYGSV